MKGDDKLEKWYQKIAEGVSILTNVSNDEILNLEGLLCIRVAIYEGFVVSSDPLQQFLVRMILDACFVEPGKRHASQ